jgi:hypothetical protein
VLEHLSVYVTLHKLCASLIVAVLCISCAGQVAPSGGPPDTTPPEILLSSPAPRTLQFQGKVIHLEFSKYLNRRSLEEGVFLSPSLGELAFDWGSKDVDIHFTDTLRPRTTYILTLGTDVTDTRRNRLAKAFQLPFSTGTTIDSAFAAGTVVDPKPAGVMIFAYKLDGRNGDTLNPSRTKPDYLTQSGKDGTFLLPYLAFGSYRLIAVRDEFKNLLYDVQTDQYGTLPSDIQLSPSAPSVSRLQFQLAAEDTSPPFLSNVKPVDKRHILVRFSEAVDPSSVTLDSFAVADTLGKHQLDLLDVSFSQSPSNEAQLATAPQDSGVTYRLRVRGARDLASNLITRAGSTLDFTPNPAPDTTRSTLEFTNIRQNQKDLLPDDSVHIEFSEAVRRGSFEGGFSLVDSAKKAVAGRFIWGGSTHVTFLPSPELRLDMAYTARVHLDSVVDLSGNRWKDSVLNRQFSTQQEGSLSSISGTVSDSGNNAKGRIMLRADNIANKGMNPRKLTVGPSASFELNRLAEGRYVITAFRDTDSNGVFSFGKPFPFRPSERFTIYPDTLKLRARWPMEGVTIRFQ